MTAADSANVYDFIDAKLSRIRVFPRRRPGGDTIGVLEELIAGEAGSGLCLAGPQVSTLRRSARW